MKSSISKWMPYGSWKHLLLNAISSSTEPGDRLMSGAIDRYHYDTALLAHDGAFVL